MTHLSKTRASIDNFFQLSYNSVLTPKIPHPWINVVYSWRKTRGFKCNIGLGGGGGDTQGEGTDVKRGLFFFLWKCLNTFVPFWSLFWGSWREKCWIFSNRWTSTEMVKQYSFPTDESFVLKVLRSCCKTWKIQYFSPDWAWIC